MNGISFVAIFPTIIERKCISFGCYKGHNKSMEGEIKKDIARVVNNEEKRREEKKGNQMGCGKRE